MHSDDLQAENLALRDIAGKTLSTSNPNAAPDVINTAFGVTISISLAMLASVEAGCDQVLMAERLVAVSDKELYRAKQEGRNRVVYEDVL